MSKTHKSSLEKSKMFFVHLTLKLATKITALRDQKKKQPREKLLTVGSGSTARLHVITIVT